jgi:hypothetical protein
MFNKIQKWINGKSTQSLFYVIAITILLLILLMIISAFMESPGKYIYLGVLMLIICVCLIILGVIVIIKREIPLPMAKFPGIIAIIGGIITILLSLLGAKSIFIRLLYWLGW